MKTHFFKAFILALLILCQSAFSADYSVRNLVQSTEGIFAKKENALTLKQLEDLVLDENVEVKIAYERLLQAQRMIGAARAEYFPYGVGTITAAYFTSAFGVLILAELVTSLPSKIFAVQRQKHLRNAQRHTLRAIKENIKNQTALIYYSLLKQEALLKLAEIELNLLEQYVAAKNNEVELGLADSNDVRDTEIHYLTVRDAYLRYKSFYLAERKALNVLVGRDFSDEQIELQPVAGYVSSDVIGMTVGEMETIAVNRSSEIRAANEMINAAIDNKRSVRWSIFSFNGIGFGYGASIKKSKSQVREAKLRRIQTETNIRNEVYTKYSNLVSFINVFKHDLGLYNITKNIVQGDIDEFNAGQRTKTSAIDSSILLLKDYRELVRTHYDALIKKDDLERAVVGSIDNATYNEDAVELVISRKRRRIRIKTISNAGANSISSVRYEFDRFLFKPMVSDSQSINFGIRLKTRNKRTIVVGKAYITMENGEQLVKEFEVK